MSTPEYPPARLRAEAEKAHKVHQGKQQDQDPLQRAAGDFHEGQEAAYNHAAELVEQWIAQVTARFAQTTKLSALQAARVVRGED